MSNNMRVIINTLEFYEAHPMKKIGLVFLDAQKAFNYVNWGFMIKQFSFEWLFTQMDIYSKLKQKMK